MPSETFFATTAQVLPTLLIAFAIEMAALLRDPLHGWRSRLRRKNISMFRTVARNPNWPAFERWLKDHEAGEVQALREQMLDLAQIVLGMIVIGEVLATWTLFRGVDKGWFTGLAAIVGVVTMTLSVAAVAAVPVARLTMEVDQPAIRTRRSRFAGSFGTRTMAEWHRDYTKD